MSGITFARERENKKGEKKKDKTVFEATEKKYITKDIACASHPLSHMASSDKPRSNWELYIVSAIGHASNSFNVTVSPHYRNMHQPIRYRINHAFPRRGPIYAMNQSEPTTTDAPRSDKEVNKQKYFPRA
jgi:hypothetical protein